MVETPSHQVMLMSLVGTFVVVIVAPAWVHYIMPMSLDAGYRLGITISNMHHRVRVPKDCRKISTKEKHKNHARMTLFALIDQAISCEIMDVDKATELFTNASQKRDYVPPKV